MILAVDIGNTSIAMGIYKEEKLVFTTRMQTVRDKTADSIISDLQNALSIYNVTAEQLGGSVVSSVVPELTQNFTKALTELIGKEPVVVGEKHNGNLRVDILPVSHLGADLIAGSIGAIRKYPLPCLVADLGTATKILAIDKDGRFCGCTISPGVKISLEALAEKTSLLPSISLSKPERVIGENTVECMQSGIVFGTAAMLDGLLSRMKREMGEEQVTFVATGGYSKEIVSCCETEIIYDENLLLDGLRSIYKDAKM